MSVGATIEQAREAKANTQPANGNGNGLLLTTKRMETKGFGSSSDIMTFDNPNKVSLEERFYNLWSGNTNGDFNPELYTNGGATIFLDNVVSKTKGYQQQTGDVAVFDDRRVKLAQFLENEKTIVLVGPGSCDKEVELIKLARHAERVIIHELSPEFNTHSYWKIKQWAAENGVTLDVKAHNDDFRDPGIVPDHGPATVICIGGLTNPENVPKEHFPSGHYTTFLEGLKTLSKPRPRMKGQGKIIMSFTTASTEAQMRGIYDNPGFHRWILHPLHRLAKGRGVSSDFNPDAFKYTGIFFPAAGLFGHHHEATENQTFQLRFTDSKTRERREETVTVFEGGQYNPLTSTGMDVGKLIHLAETGVGLNDAGTLAADDSKILQRWQMFTYG